MDVTGDRTPASPPAGSNPGEPRKVLFFIPSMDGGGAERVLATLLQRVDRNRIRPSLALMRMEGPHLASIPAEVPITDLSARSLWTVLPALAREIHRQRPDVLFSMTGGANIPAVLAHALTKSRARLVLSERNVLVGSKTGLKRRFILWLKSVLYPRADRITAVAEAVRRDLEKVLELPSQKLELVHNPIIDDELELRSREPVDHPWFSESTPIILCVARLVPQKDHLTLLEACRLLLRDRACRLVLLGDGELRAVLEARVRELGLEDAVWFGGFVDNPFQYMRACQVFVLPSLQEGLPGVVIQAMACGAPVVATDAPGGTAELVHDGRTGLLVPTRNPEALTAAISRLLDDPELRASLSAEAYAIVQRRFRTDRVVVSYENAALGATHDTVT